MESLWEFRKLIDSSFELDFAHFFTLSLDPHVFGTLNWRDLLEISSVKQSEDMYLQPELQKYSKTRPQNQKNPALMPESFRKLL